MIQLKNEKNLSSIGVSNMWSPKLGTNKGFFGPIGKAFLRNIISKRMQPRDLFDNVSLYYFNIDKIKKTKF